MIGISSNSRYTGCIYLLYFKMCMYSSERVDEYVQSTARLDFGRGLRVPRCVVFISFSHSDHETPACLPHGFPGHDHFGYLQLQEST